MKLTATVTARLEQDEIKLYKKLKLHSVTTRELVLLGMKKKAEELGIDNDT